MWSRSNGWRLNEMIYGYIKIEFMLYFINNNNNKKQQNKNRPI